MDWQAEPYWVFWEHQLALLAQASAYTPEPQLTADAAKITQLLRREELGAHRQQLGALRHGAKHWKRRR